MKLVAADERYDPSAGPGERYNIINSPDHTAIHNNLHDCLSDWLNISLHPLAGLYFGMRAWG